MMRMTTLNWRAVISSRACFTGNRAIGLHRRGPRDCRRVVPTTQSSRSKPRKNWPRPTLPSGVRSASSTLAARRRHGGQQGVRAGEAFLPVYRPRQPKIDLAAPTQGPAWFYLVSYPAHTTYPTRLATEADAEPWSWFAARRQSADILNTFNQGNPELPSW